MPKSKGHKKKNIIKRHSAVSRVLGKHLYSVLGVWFYGVVGLICFRFSAWVFRVWFGVFWGVFCLVGFF